MARMASNTSTEHDERNPQLKVLPMFGAMLIVDSEVTRTIDYGYNYAGSLHWGFDIRFHQPITKMSDHLETMVRLEGLYDRGEGRGLLAQHIGDTYRFGRQPAFHERILGLPDLRRRLGWTQASQGHR